MFNLLPALFPGMAVYQIHYDLNRPGQKCQELYDAIRDLSDSYHRTGSTFFVKTDLEATDIRDELQQVVDSSDTIIVTVIGKRGPVRWATNNSGGVAEWLKENL